MCNLLRIAQSFADFRGFGEFGAPVAIRSRQENNTMKLLTTTLLAVTVLGALAPKSYADPVLTVNAGVTGGVLVETPIVGGFSWVYTDDHTAVGFSPVNHLPDLLTDNNVFTATFTDIAGVKLLNVNDICANVGVNIAPTPCSLGFTFTDASLGTPYLVSDVALLGVLGLNLDANALGITVADVSVGGGHATIGFNPPGTPAPAPTPEPGTLSLMGTSLLGVAGVMRRKFRSA
jgi:hypothetical protein